MGVLVKSVFRYEGVVYMTPCVVDLQHMYTSIVVVFFFLSIQGLFFHMIVDLLVTIQFVLTTHPWFLLYP